MSADSTVTGLLLISGETEVVYTHDWSPTSTLTDDDVADADPDSRASKENDELPKMCVPKT